MLNNVPLRERSGCPPGGLLLHPSPLLFPRVPSLDPSTVRVRFSRFSAFSFFFFFPLWVIPLFTEGRDIPLSMGLAQLATLAVSPGVPRSRASPWLPVHLAALLLTETSFCRRQNLPSWPGRPSRGHPPPTPSTSEQNLLPLGANGPCAPMRSRSGPSGARPTCRHAGKGGRASGLPGLLLHTHTQKHIHVP